MRVAWVMIAVFVILVLASSYAHGGIMGLLDAAVGFSLVAALFAACWLFIRAL